MPTVFVRSRNVCLQFLPDIVGSVDVSLRLRARQIREQGASPLVAPFLAALSPPPWTDESQRLVFIAIPKTTMALPICATVPCMARIAAASGWDSISVCHGSLSLRLEGPWMHPPIMCRLPLVPARRIPPKTMTGNLLTPPFRGSRGLGQRSLGETKVTRDGFLVW